MSPGSNETTEPGLHALIVGVSKYPYLEGGEHFSGHAPSPLKLSQLSSSATSALMLYRWIEQHASLFAVPLASRRLLLSPTAAEIERFPEMRERTAGCTIEDFRSAVYAWYRSALSHDDNMTLFYFAGHGLQAGPYEDLMLLEDFGSDIGPTMRGAVSVGNVFRGMAATVPTIARTQLYFIDASRVNPRGVEELLTGTTQMFDEVRGLGADVRNAMIFTSARPGEHAYQLAGQGTLFLRDLLEGLSGKAAILERDQRDAWCVTVSSLSHWMATAASRTSQEFNLPRPLGFSVSGNVTDADAVLVRLDHIPTSRVTVEIEGAGPRSPEVSEASIVLEGEDGRTLTTRPGATLEGVPAGFYVVRLEEPAPFPTARSIALISPPDQRVVLRRSG